MKLKDLKFLKFERYYTFLGLRVSAWVEIFCFFIITTLIAFFAGISFNFFGVCPHPFWILVLLISAQYGTVEGIVAAIVSSLVLLAGPLPLRSILQDRSEYFLSLTASPLEWFVAAVILGELRMKHIRERNTLIDAALEAKEREQKIADAYQALKKLKERLEMRVASEMQTTLSVINGFKDLEAKGKEGIIKGAAELTKSLVAPEKFSIFLLEPDGLKCVYKNNWKEDDPYVNEFPPASLLYQEIVEKRRLVSVQGSDPRILNDQGVLAVPLMSTKTRQVFGMIKLEEIPFLRLRTTAIESLHSIGDWVGSAYANTLEKEEHHG